MSRPAMVADESRQMIRFKTVDTSLAIYRRTCAEGSVTSTAAVAIDAAGIAAVAAIAGASIVEAAAKTPTLPPELLSLKLPPPRVQAQQSLSLPVWEDKQSSELDTLKTHKPQPGHQA
jgi:hypothetical protein